MNSIPVLDLRRFESADPTIVARAARELDDICREIGFLVISNHGVAEETQKALYDAGRAFFDLRMESKMTVRRPHHERPVRRLLRRGGQLPSPLQTTGSANRLILQWPGTLSRLDATH